MNEFKRALGALGEVIGRETTVEYLNGMASVLWDHDEDQLVKACAVLARSIRWLPAPVDFIDLIERGELPGHRGDDGAAMAWGRLQRVLSNATKVRALCDGDERIDAGVDALGGWFAMMNSGEDPKWQRKVFTDAYQGAARSARQNTLLPGGVLQLEDGER